MSSTIVNGRYANAEVIVTVGNVYTITRKYLKLLVPVWRRMVVFEN